MEINNNTNILESNYNKQRIAWVDAAKFLGILAVYIGHYGTLAGNLYPFVFSYHVPLFFFLSGLFGSKSQDSTFLKYVFKKARQLLIPYFVFLILSIIIRVLYEQISILDVLHLFKLGVFGIRNQVEPVQLWFLPCLFIVSIIYELLRIFVKKRLLILLISFLFSILFTRFVYTGPKWFFNIDSAFVYLVYYAAASYLFPVIRKFSFKKLKLIKKSIFLVLSTIAVLIFCLQYFQKDYISPLLGNITILHLLYIMIKTFILIYVNILTAVLLAKFKLIRTIGEHSLYMFGNEYIIKTIIPLLLITVGLKVYLETPLVVFIFSFILLILTNYLLVPLEKEILFKLSKRK